MVKPSGAILPRSRGQLTVKSLETLMLERVGDQTGYFLRVIVEK